MNIYKIKYFLYIFIFFFSLNNAFSLELSEKILNFLKKNDAIYLNHVELTILSKKNVYQTPYHPRFIFPYHYKKWGNTEILMVTAEKTIKIKIYIKIFGYYFLTNKNLKKHSTLHKNDFISKIGNFNLLPKDIVLDKKLIINKKINKNMIFNQIITNSILKPLFLIKKNDEIKIFFNFSNVYVSTIGTALNNACIGDKVKVMLPSGYILIGTLDTNGNVKLIV